MKFVKNNNVTSQIEFKNIKSILSMYLYTLGTLFLGFSILVLVEDIKKNLNSNETDLNFFLRF